MFMMTRRQAALACTTALASFSAEVKTNTGSRVRLHRLPDGGLQPQAALDDRGMLHLVFYSGDPHKGDLLYMTSSDSGASFSPTFRVNRQPGSAVAVGTIRGAQIALGKKGRLHVAWNGSNEAALKGPVNPESGKPGMAMLYTHVLDTTGTTSFAPERNLMLSSFGLDGGGSVAADRSGNVFVAWHGIGLSEGSGSGKEGEARRSVWITRSSDDGQSFSRETKAWTEPTALAVAAA